MPRWIGACELKVIHILVLDANPLFPPSYGSSTLQVFDIRGIRWFPP
jgi:hypothetical protein